MMSDCRQLPLVRKLDSLRSGKLKEDYIVRTRRHRIMLIGVTASKLYYDSMVCIGAHWNLLLKQQKISENFVVCLQMVLFLCNARTRENTENITRQYSLPNSASSTYTASRRHLSAQEIFMKDKKLETLVHLSYLKE